MKSIFLCKEIIINNEPIFNTVYSPEMRETLKTEAGTDDRTYTYDDVIASPGSFKDTEFIFSTWGMPALTEDEIKTVFPSLKCVFYSAGTVQAFARPFINCGVKVFSAWAANAVPVAEYTAAQIILANKSFFVTSRLFKSNSHKEAAALFREFPGNYGNKIGIIGAGMIGKLVITLLKNYKFDILVFDPFLPDEKAAELGVTKTSLEHIFSECSVISNHLANNEQTKGMLNYSHFSKVRKNATFLNTGRGAQVVEADLIHVLKERPDFTAVLDVTDPEPPLEDSEFYTLDNCILTPHIAGSSGLECQRLAEYMLEEFRLYTKNLPTNYEISLKMLETMA